MTWEIFIGITSIVGFLAIVVPPIVKLYTILAKLQQVVDGIIDKFKDSKKEQDKIIEKLETHETELSEHDKRITVLEIKTK